MAIELIEPAAKQPTLPIELADAAEEDLDGILEIYNDVLLNSTAVFAWDPVDRANRLAWLKDRQAQDYPVLVARIGLRVIGFASFGDWRGGWPGYRFTVEHSVHVHRDYRGQAVGSRLMLPLMDRARALAKHVMVGGIDAANEASLRFHQRLGFRKVAHLHQVGQKFGRWLDLIFMQTFL